MTGSTVPLREQHKNQSESVVAGWCCVFKRAPCSVLGEELYLYIGLLGNCLFLVWLHSVCAGACSAGSAAVLFGVG